MAYCAAAWGLIEAASFFIERYGASQRLLDILIGIIAAGLPATLFITWRLTNSRKPDPNPLDKVPGIADVKKIGLLNDKACPAGHLFATLMSWIEIGCVIHPRTARKSIMFTQFEPVTVPQLFVNIAAAAEAKGHLEGNRLFIYPIGETPWKGVTVFGTRGDPAKPKRYAVDGHDIRLGELMDCLCGCEDLKLSIPTDILGRSAAPTIDARVFDDLLRAIEPAYEIRASKANKTLVVEDAMTR